MELKTTMQSFFNRPYPSNYERNNRVVIAASYGLFVSLFLMIFQPFGISMSTDPLYLLKTAGFGLVTFLVMLFVYLALPVMYPDFFKEKNYTIGKELIVSAFLILLIGLANSAYAHIFVIQPSKQSILNMIWQTFLVGIFPISFLTLLQYNRLYKSNTKVSQAIKLSSDRNSNVIRELAEQHYYSISTEQDNTPIILENLLFLESDGNYVHLYQVADKSYTKTMHRATLKSLEEENSFQNVVRCHRSFIVNLDQVIDVSGNAQGLKLKLNGVEEEVPVSRKYISAVKDYLNRSK